LQSTYQGEEQPDTELFLWIVPFLHITLFVGVVEGKKRIVNGRGRRNGGNPQ